MNKEYLTGLIEKVAELRGDVVLAKTKSDFTENRMAETPEGKAFQLCSHRLKVEGEFLFEAESKLKSAVLEAYKETGEKKPIDKVEVKIFKRLEYDLAEALTWCRTNALSLLVVNRKLFEKAAVAIDAPVKVKEEAKCTIASDLSSYLSEQEEEKAKPKGEKNVDRK